MKIFLLATLLFVSCSSDVSTHPFHQSREHLTQKLEFLNNDQSLDQFLDKVILPKQKSVFQNAVKRFQSALHKVVRSDNLISEQGNTMFFNVSCSIAAEIILERAGTAKELSDCEKGWEQLFGNTRPIQIALERNSDLLVNVRLLFNNVELYSIDFASDRISLMIKDLKYLDLLSQTGSQTQSGSFELHYYPENKIVFESKNGIKFDHETMHVNLQPLSIEIDLKNSQIDWNLGAADWFIKDLSKFKLQYMPQKFRQITFNSDSLPDDSYCRLVPIFFEKYMTLLTSDLRHQPVK